MAASALLATSRQIRSETQDLLASSRKLVYHVDVMFIEGSGLWPTWLSIPTRSLHVDEVHAQFRIHELPPDLAPVWESPGLWGGGEEGAPGGNVMFYELLARFLQSGPAGLDRSRQQYQAVYSIGRLRLDVQLVPDGEDHGLFLERPGPGTALFGGLDWYVVRRDDGRLVTARSLEETDPRRLPAERLAYFMSHSLEMVLRMTQHAVKYGKVLYEGIGVVEISVGGEVRWAWDLEAMFRTFASGHEQHDAVRGHQTSEFKMWRQQAQELRRLRALDVVESPSTADGEIWYDAFWMMPSVNYEE
ncbi:hypothetical protein ACHAQH_008968 [Verticillium albo-atrum]